jgi:polyhydroxyalkanoate synthesis regulator phasin
MNRGLTSLAAAFVLLAHSAGATETPWWARTRAAAEQAWERALQWIGDDPGEQARLAAIWDDLVPKLDETLAEVETARTLPESSWFGRDRRSAQNEIDALLDEAVEILSRSPTAEVRGRIRALESRIEALRHEIDEYRLKKVAAPRDSLWRRTMDEYDRAIADNEARIEALEAELEREKAAFAAALRGMGLEIDARELDVLLASVVGDDLVRMAVVFDNVKQVTAQLERLMAESGERMETARRYYGMYTVLLRILAHMHETALEQIRHTYLPRIDAIVSRTRNLERETRALLRRSPGDRALLEANLQAQALTLEAARQYRGYLQDQARELEARLQGLRKDLEVAQNTYETVKVSGELLGLMRASRRSLEALSRLEMPQLQGFRNRELREEFRRLTEQLRTGA